MQRFSTVTVPFSLRIGQANREDDSHSPSHLPGPIITGIAIYEEPNYSTVSGFRPTSVGKPIWSWSTRMAQVNGKSVLMQEPDLTMETYAS